MPTVSRFWSSATPDKTTWIRTTAAQARSRSFGFSTESSQELPSDSAPSTRSTMIFSGHGFATSRAACRPTKTSASANPARWGWR
jgi:hypothetical protein